MARNTIIAIPYHRHKHLRIVQICIVKKILGIRNTVAGNEICTLKYCG
jgi:hypothetical protein